PFSFTTTAPPSIYTLSLHDALPIFEVILQRAHPGLHLLLLGARQEADVLAERHGDARHDDLGVALLVEHLGEARGEREQRLAGRSEEHTSELQSPCNLVCRLLLEKK